MLRKLVGTDFQVIPCTSYIQNIRNILLCLPELKLVKNFIFPYSTAGKFVVQIDIISVTKIRRHTNFSLVHQTEGYLIL